MFAALLAAGVLDRIWDWAAGVFGRIADVSPWWLALALGLKTSESALIGLGFGVHMPMHAKVIAASANGPSPELDRLIKSPFPRWQAWPARFA